MVQKLHILFSPYDLELEEKAPVFWPAYTRLVFRVLREMKNLKTLEIDNSTSHLATCPFKLDKLCVIAWGKQDLTFFERQEALREITFESEKMWGVHDTRRIRDGFHDEQSYKELSRGSPRTLLPHIQVVSTKNQRFAVAVIPGRPVTELELGTLDSAFTVEKKKLKIKYTS